MIISLTMIFSAEKSARICARSNVFPWFVAFLWRLPEPRRQMNRDPAPPVERKGEWEHFPHDADVGLRGWGATPAEAFEQAAYALTAVVTHAAVEPKFSVQLTCKAPDLELLLVEWLNAIIYEMAVRNMLFGRFPSKSKMAVLKGCCGVSGSTSSAMRRPVSRRGRLILL